MGARWVDRGVAGFGAISFVRRAVGLGLTAGLASWGFAPIAAASTNFHAYINGMNFYETRAYTVNDIAVDGSFSPTPMVDLHEGGIGDSSVQIGFYYHIEGPVSDIAIPIEVEATLEIDYDNSAVQPIASWDVVARISAASYFPTIDPYEPISLSDGSSEIRCSADSCVEMHEQQQQQVILRLNSLVGAENIVGLMASAVNHNASASTLHARVSGTIVRFAPGFDSTGYRIVLDDGVGNSAVVPEPGTAILFGGGLIGLALRRRSRC